MDSKYYETFDLLKSAIPLVFLRLSVCYTIYTVGELKDLTLLRAIEVKLPKLRAVPAGQE